MANLLTLVRHPLMAAAWLRRRLRRPRRGRKVRVTVSEEELREFANHNDALAVRFDDQFGKHPKLTMYYEEVVRNRDKTLAEAQSFLDVEPKMLTVMMERQNPQPLRELIANYEELYEAFRSTQLAHWFE